MALFFNPLYIDTGVNAMYARKTTISSRINSMQLLDRVLPTRPDNNTDDGRGYLEPAVWDLIPHTPKNMRKKGGSRARSSGGANGAGPRESIFDGKYAFYELHVLVHALHDGNVLDRDILTAACHFKEAVFEEQKRTGACLTVLVNATDDGANSPAKRWKNYKDSSEDDDETADDQGAAAPGPAIVAEFTPRKPAPAHAPSGAPQDTDASERHAARHAALSARSAARPGAETPKPADSGSANDPDERAGRSDAEPGQNEDEQERDRKMAEKCQAPFSLFAVRPAIEAAGYGAQLHILSQVRPYATPEAVDMLTQACAAPEEARGIAMCAASWQVSSGNNISAPICASEACDAAEPECIVNGMDPCNVINTLKPTAAELQTVAALPAEPLDVKGCDNIDWRGLKKQQAAFAVLLQWAKRSTEFSDFALLVNALVDTTFAKSNGTRGEVTRLVFGLPNQTKEARICDTAAAHSPPPGLLHCTTSARLPRSFCHSRCACMSCATVPASHRVSASHDFTRHEQAHAMLQRWQHCMVMQLQNVAPSGHAHEFKVLQDTGASAGQTSASNDRELRAAAGRRAPHERHRLRVAQLALFRCLCGPGPPSGCRFCHRCALAARVSDAIVLLSATACLSKKRCTVRMNSASWCLGRYLPCNSHQSPALYLAHAWNLSFTTTPQSTLLRARRRAGLPARLHADAGAQCQPDAAHRGHHPPLLPPRPRPLHRCPRLPLDRRPALPGPLHHPWHRCRRHLCARSASVCVQRDGLRVHGSCSCVGVKDEARGLSGAAFGHPVVACMQAVL